MYHFGKKTIIAAAGVASIICASVLPVSSAIGQEVFELRVSVDTNMQTSRTRHLALYLDEVEKRSEGRVKPILYHSAQLFADRDVGKALIQGAIEMALPGSWTLSGIVSDLDFPGLPSFFGISTENARKVVDGEVGDIINAKLEKKLRSHVIGRWHELEPLHTYAVKKKIKSFSDMKGMRIRHPGSGMLELVISSKGATAVVVPWPDVALALTQGKIDGLVSTHNTVVSGKLWDSGVTHAFEDFNARMFQVLLINQEAWDGLPADMQKLMEDTWEDMLPGFLENIRGDDDAMREILVEHGFTVARPTQEELKEIQEALAPTEEDAVAKLKIDPRISAAIQKVTSGQ